MRPEEQRIPNEVLTAVEPRSVQAILVACGYELLGMINDGRYKGRAVFEKDSNSQLIFPMEQSVPDYVDSLVSVAQHLGERFNASTNSFLEQFVSPHTDKIQYQVAVYPETRFGNIPLEAIQNLSGSLYRVLRHSAREIAKRLCPGSRQSELARNFIAQCKFSQTQYGSFVANILCPSIVHIIEYEGERIPFGQKATKKAVGVFRALSSDSFAPSEEMIRDKAIYTAISEIDSELPTLDRPENHVWVRYSSLKVRNGEFFHSDEIAFDRNLYTRARDVISQINRWEQIERREWTGFVTDLHLDSPIVDEDSRDRHIELQVRAASGYRKIRVMVDPESYETAVTCNRQDMPVKLDAKVDTSKRNWCATELFSLKPSRPDEPLLENGEN